MHSLLILILVPFVSHSTFHTHSHTQPYIYHNIFVYRDCHLMPGAPCSFISCPLVISSKKKRLKFHKNKMHSSNSANIFEIKHRMEHFHCISCCVGNPCGDRQQPYDVQSIWHTIINIMLSFHYVDYGRGFFCGTRCMSNTK